MTETRVPSPADFLPGWTARELIAEVERQGGRLHRMAEPPMVFCLCDRIELVRLLQDAGARTHIPPHLDSTDGSYERTRGGKREWDLWVHTIGLEGDETIWQALTPGEAVVE